MNKILDTVEAIDELARATERTSRAMHGLFSPTEEAFYKELSRRFYLETARREAVGMLFMMLGLFAGLINKQYGLSLIVLLCIFGVLAINHELRK